MYEFQIQSERLKLRNLHHWVTLGGMSFILLPGAAMFQLASLLIGMSVIMLGFSIYILRALHGLGKQGWITGYAILIGIPFLLALILSGTEILGAVIWLFPLAMFYFYCWILRYSISEWLSDVGDEKAFELDKKEEKPYQDILDRFK